MAKKKYLSKRSTFQKSVTWLIIVIFFFQPILASAETVADSNASGDNRPVIETTANGITMVQITAPSAAGVSRNQYSKFNVDASGLVLNNSTAITQTQLAGYVERNVNLGTSARIILNEVTSTNPTSLNGYIEVAGQKADVIVANPNGISGDGFGFINTSRAVLTTGIPVFGGSGSLDAFRVTGGEIAIQGSGLNASSVDQVDLISRATTVNAGIWANNLNIIAGTNQVDYSTLAIQKLSGDTNTPQVAIDVGALGGMYANKIFLVGTENGVGVKSEGILSASTGDLTVTSEGQVVLSNSTSAGGNIQVTGKDGITNTGTLYAQGNAILATNGNIDNQAVLAAGNNVTLSGTNISSTGTVGAGIQSDGSLGTTGDLTVQAQDTSSTSGQNLIAGNLSITAGKIDLESSSTYVGGDATWISSGDINHTGSTTQVGGTLTATAQGTINNSENAAGKVGSILANQFDLTAQTIDNSEGTIEASQTATIQADSVINTGGRLAANKDLNISADQITGDGEMIAGQDVTLNVKQDFVNEASGVVQANNNLQITSDNTVTNQGGLSAVGIISVSGTNIINDASGTIAAQHVVLQTAGDVANAGRIDGSDIEITAQKSVKNTGKVFGDTLTITANQLTNQGEDGVLATNVQTNLLVSGTADSADGASVENKDGATIYSLGDINIAGGAPDAQTGQYNVKVDSVLNQSATIEADGNIGIYANSITNKKREFELESQTTTTTVSTDITPWDGYYKATRNYTETSTQLVVVKDSDPGEIIAGKDMTLEGKIENNVSTITAGGTLTYDSSSLTNIGYSNSLQVVSSGTDTQTRSERYCSHKVLGACVDHDWRDVSVAAPYYEETSTNLDGYNAIISANVIKGTGGTVDNRTVTPAGAPVGSTDTTSSTTKEFTFEVPKSGLYTVHTESSAKYLVETDAQFTNYKSFLSSDYLLEKLSADPENVQKRLGDGFYEQKLVLEQILEQTGKSYIEGYSSSEEQYAALMNNAVTEAAELKLTVGVALTADQLANLKSDIVWMVEKEVDGQKVLAPVVYLASTSTSKLTSSGALITANSIEMSETGTVTNSGVIQATDSTTITADTITNYGGTIESGGTTTLNASQDIVNQSGSIVGGEVELSAGGDIRNETVVLTVSQENVTTTLNNDQAVIKATEGELTVQAGQDIINNGAVMKAAADVTLEAGRNIETDTVESTKHAELQTGSSTYVQDSVTNQVSTIEGGGNVTLTAQGDATLKGTMVTAGDSLTLTAGGNISIEAAKDRDMEDYSSTGKATYRRSLTDNETLVSSELTAQNNVTVTAKAAADQTTASDESQGNILIQGSTVTSNSGTITLTADQDVTIKEESVRQETLTQSKDKTEGVLSKKQTETLDHTIDNTVGSSTISGEQVIISSGDDITVQGSNVAATSEVALQAANNITVTTAQETVETENDSYTKETGISFSLTSSGAGLFAGSTSSKTTQTETDVNQVASVVGSTDGKVTIAAQKDVSITGSQVSSKTGTDVTGQNVTIEAAESTTDIQTTTEYTQSGLGISVGNSTIKSIGEASDEINHAGEVQDKRLQNLLAYQATENTLDAVSNVNSGTALSAVTISVGTSNTKETSETLEKTTTAQGSTVSSDGDIKITATGSGQIDEQGKATDGNISVVSSAVSGSNIDLEAVNNIELTAAENTSTSDTITSSKSSGYGVDLNVSGAVTGLYASSSKSSGTENTDATTHTETQITAQNTLTIKSGQDSSLTGAQVQGDTIVATIGGNLTLESQQDTDNYKANKTSTDGRIDIGLDVSVDGVDGSVTKTKTDSTYSSVVEQTSISAGTGGFDITVGNNTDLKGAVIASTADADKNKLTTDTLTYSNLENKAEYSASSVGVNVNTTADAKYNESGVTPNIGVPSSGKAKSTTKSAIASGKVQTHSGETITLENLSRDANTVTEALGKIFDKTSVKEKQELSQIFGEEAYKLVHVISEESGWVEGSAQKVALHALVGALMAKLGRGDVLSGAAGAGFNQVLQGELSKIKDPAARQWASAFVGAVAAKAIGGNAQTGGATAASGTKNNAEWISAAEQLAIQKGAELAVGYKAGIAMGMSPQKATIFAGSTSLALGLVDNAYNWSGKIVDYYNSGQSYATPQIDYDTRGSYPANITY